jgi:hypothetical protein
MRSFASTPLLDNRFLLLQTLGRGGMGCVYRAFDRAEERLVALKVHRSRERSGPSHPLCTEYDAWSRVQHPNIIRAFELGLATRGPIPDGTPYLVLEDFPGLPADRVLDPGRLGPVDLEEFSRRVLQALEHVHAAGLVHRDLKPANVLVGRTRKGPGRIKLTDFGLAAPVGQAGEPGRVSGSVPFVAPESVVGGPVDGRTDLYGLGILLYFLATGQMPVRSRDPGEVLRWHLEGPPADPRKVFPEYPERLSRFIRRLTARPPAHRPASAAEALVLLGDRPRSQGRQRQRDSHRAELATLRLALDAVRLGARRCHRLPSCRTASKAVLREAAVLCQVRGLFFYRLRAGGRRRTSNLGRLVLHLLIGRGAEVRKVIGRHGLHRGLPLGVLGGLPVWDRMRAESGPVPTDAASLRATARGVAAFLLDSAERQPIAIVVEKAATADPLARLTVDLLIRAASGKTSHLPAKGGILLLLAPGVDADQPAQPAQPASRRGSAPNRRCLR